MTTEPADLLRQDLELALRAALAGARVGMPYFSRVQGLAQELKSDGTIVTEADRAVEQTVRDVLLRERPTDACLGEETGETGHGNRRWILDGIDGTAVFVQGDDSWQSLVALEVSGEIVVGVAILPARRQVWWAARGLGAFVATIAGDMIGVAERLKVRTGATMPERALLGIVPAISELPPARRAVAEPIVARLMEVSPPRPWAVHAALLVATGELDVAVQVLGSVWDYAALSLIVEEAGGSFSGAEGRGHPVVGTGIFAKNETLRAATLTLLP